MCRQVLVPLCGGCENLEECTKNILSVLNCQHTVEHDLKTIRNLSKLLESLCSRNGSCQVNLIASRGCNVEALYHTVCALKDYSTRITLIAPWSLFQSLLPHPCYAKVLKHVCKAYIYVVSDGELLTASHIVRSKPLSRFKDILVLSRYVASEDDLASTLKSYRWRGTPKLCLILPTPISLRVERVIREEGFRLVDELVVMGLPGKGFLDSMTDRFIEVVSTKGKNGSRTPTIVLHPLLDPSKLVTTETRNTIARNTRLLEESIEKNLLENSIWEVEVRVRVDGTVVLDRELLSILKSISNNKTLTHASTNIGLSYPKVKKKIELAEKALGVRLVDVEKGGVIRGRSTLTPEAERILELYDLITRSLSRKLRETIEELIMRKNGKTKRQRKLLPC